MAKDLKTKLLLYQQFGVKEYWIVNPDNNTVEVLTLDPTGKYIPGRLFDLEDTLFSSIFDGLTLSMEELFRGD